MNVRDGAIADLPRVNTPRPVVLPLRVNFAWTLLGNAVYAASQWGMLIVLAKLGTSTMVGQFALGLAVTAPIFMLANMQLRGIQATDTKGEYQFADYLGLRLLMSLLALCTICGVVACGGYRRETALVILAIGLAKASESLSDICYGFFQQHELMDTIAKSMMLKGVLSLLALGGGILLTQNVLWGALLMAGVWGGLLVTYDLRQVRERLQTSSSIKTTPYNNNSQLSFLLWPRWNAARLSGLVRLSLPLGLVMMLISLNTNIPRYFVERYWGEQRLGMYAALAYLMVAGTTVISALGQSATPRLARYYATGSQSAFASLLLKLCGIATILGIVGVGIATSIGPEVVSLLYQPEYAQHSDVFWWLMVASGISYIASFLGYGMTAARYFKIQTPLFATVVGVTSVMCSLLVPQHGLIGAAQASVIAAIVSVIGAVLVNLHAWRKLSITR